MNKLGVYDTGVEEVFLCDGCTTEGDFYIREATEPGAVCYSCNVSEDELDEGSCDGWEDDLDHDGSPLRFADPGGVSALRAETPDNPRNLPCPNCGRKNVLTPKDRDLGYQCDACARQAEMGY